MKIFSSDTLKGVCVNNIKKSKSVVKPAFSKQIKQKVKEIIDKKKIEERTIEK